jgi:hypothetical protein
MLIEPARVGRESDELRVTSQPHPPVEQHIAGSYTSSFSYAFVLARDGCFPPVRRYSAKSFGSSVPRFPSIARSMFFAAVFFAAVFSVPAFFAAVFFAAVVFAVVFFAADILVSVLFGPVFFAACLATAYFVAVSARLASCCASSSAMKSLRKPIMRLRCVFSAALLSRLPRAGARP